MQIGGFRRWRYEAAEGLWASLLHLFSDSQFPLYVQTRRHHVSFGGRSEVGLYAALVSAPEAFYQNAALPHRSPLFLPLDFLFSFFEGLDAFPPWAV